MNHCLHFTLNLAAPPAKISSFCKHSCFMCQRTACYCPLQSYHNNLLLHPKLFIEECVFELSQRYFVVDREVLGDG